MYKYEEFILPYIPGKYKINERGELIGLCPFHDETHPSFSINLETGFYNCFSCGESGNLTTFIASMENISTKEAFKLIHQGEYAGSNYKLEDFAREKHFDIDYLKLLGLSNGFNCIQIPYYDEQENIIGTRLRFNPPKTGKEKDNSKFSWKKGSKINLYGLNGLNDIVSNDYIVLVEGESDAITLWSYGIPCVGVPGANNLKKSSAEQLERFEKIYVHNEGDRGGENFVKNACKVFPFEKLYTVSSKQINPQCKDPSDLHIAGIFDKDKFFATAQKIDKTFYDEANSVESTAPVKIETEEELEEHVQIAEKIRSSMHIKYYGGNFYVYENGVYRPDELAIERKILEINRNAKKHLRDEVFGYIRIQTKVIEVDKNTQFINFKNGMYDLTNHRLVPHSPKYFTTCQINAYYFEPQELKFHKGIDDFLNDISYKNFEIKQTILQIIGYSMTYRTDLQLAFFFYGPTARNGKSTLIEIINTIIGKSNICHVTMQQLCERFSSSLIVGKLLNTETEIEQNAIKSIEMFKKITTSDEITVERKYHDPEMVKPFCKLIFASNVLPKLDNIYDEGYYRRLFILPFNRRFTDEEVNNFDINELLTEDAINYLANISLQEYLKIADTKKLAFAKGSNEIINKYRKSNNSVKVFLDDDTVISEIFANGNIVPRTVMYGKYVNWCNKMKFFIKKKNEFYDEVLSRPEYQEAKGLGGKDCFRNTNKSSTPPQLPKF